MPRKYTITYHEVHSPITEPVTKFGGQPVWIAAPRWPLSREYGTPMQFICQIALPVDLFSDIEPQMAYLFVTDWDGEGVFPETFDPEKGENALILQPGSAWERPLLSLGEGPTLYRRVCRNETWVQESCEFAVELQPGEDPEVGAWDEVWGNPERRDESARDAYWDALTEDKIGGSPVPTPFHKEVLQPWRIGWRLLLQLNTHENDPYFLNLSPDGVGYAFVSEDGHMGKFLWTR